MPSGGLLALVGMPGSGKSTIGRALARRLDRPFIDTDKCIESRIGCPIRDFFAAHGEARFREIESTVLEEVLAGGEAVVATGGGIVIAERNRVLLRQKALVFYLRATVNELARRVARDTQRPLLQVADPRARLQQLLAQRDPLYREVAHFTLEDPQPTVGRLLRKAIMQLDSAGFVSRKLRA